MFGEERIETELAIEFQREPAPAPLARTLEGELIQPDLHHARVIGRRGTIMREQSNLRRRVGIGGMGVERFAPDIALGIIDLAEVEHLALSDAPVMETFVFDDTPVGVFLAIFFANLRTQKHNDRREYTPSSRWEGSGSSLQALLKSDDALSLAIPLNSPPKIIETTIESAKSG